MKKNIYTLLGTLLLIMVLSACDENDPTPGYEVIGRSYETIAHVTVSDDEPLPGQTIEVTVSYVNYMEDPAVSITYIVERNDSKSTEDTTDESGKSEGEYSYTYDYTVPGDAAGETITFIGEFRSAEKEYPQVEEASIDVQEE